MSLPHLSLYDGHIQLVEGADGGATITGVTVTYTAISNNVTPSDGVMDVAYPDASIVILGLQPLTNYSVMVVVINDVAAYVGGSTPVEIAVETLSLGKWF